MADPTAPEFSPRKQRRDARVKRIRDAAQVKRVRVAPTSEEFRQAIKHPQAGGFRSTGSIEWPLDQFTRRRIADGTVTVEERPARTSSETPRRSPPAS